MSIASRASFSDDSRKSKNKLPKSLLLRDYLLDDMSSCSSNGFRSYPRRQCCTTVRFLIETDLKKHHKMFSKPHRTSNMKPKQSSMLQKASEVMIKAFKRLPFVDAKRQRKAKLLPRSLSRKLLKHGFWNKTDQPNKKTKRLTTFGDLIKQEDVTPLPLPLPLPSGLSTAVTSAVTVEILSLTSNSDSWSATTESLTTTGNSSELNLAQNDVADELHEKMKETNGNSVGVTTVNNYSDATENAKKWQGNQDEQFSPVSVMDFPSDSDVDEEDEVSLMSPRKHLNVKGAKISTHKTRISDRVPQLEPVKLEDRIAQSVVESSTTTFHDFVQEENQVEKKAMALLHLLKSTVSSHHLLKYEAVESLLLAFLKESTLEANVSDYEVLQRAKDWMDRQEEEQDIFIDWECENNRQTYLIEMEKGVKWSNYDHQVEKVNVGLEVELEIFNSLVNDVLTEFYLLELDHED